MARIGLKVKPKAPPAPSAAPAAIKIPDVKMRISKISSDGKITLKFNQAIVGPSLEELNGLEEEATGGRLRGLSDELDQDEEEGVAINGYLTQDQRRVMAINGIMTFMTKSCCIGTIQTCCSTVKSPRRLM